MGEDNVEEEVKIKKKKETTFNLEILCYWGPLDINETRNDGCLECARERYR